MEWLHALFATLAAFRLTTLFTQDAIWHPVRTRFPRIPWHCALCMSVWAGAAATAFLIAMPWLNWPLAMSWIYLAYERTRKPVDNAEIEARVAAMQSEYEMQAAAIMRRSALMNAEVASANARTSAAQKRIEELEKEVASLKPKEN